MSDLLVSWIRTAVPVGVTALTAWLLSKGIVVGDEAEAGLVTGLSGLVGATYYALARILERKYPWLGFLLGSRKQPTYSKEGE